MDKSGFHYGWVVVIAGIGVLFACLGMGRFSLGMILPSMGKSLALSYSQMGWIGTANFAGYMASVIVAGRVASKIGARNSIFIGLFLVAVSMAGISAANGFISATLCYLITGVGSGLANVPAMGLISHWFYKSVRGKAAGFILTGNSLGVIFSGLFIPFVNTWAGMEGWRNCWLYMGGLSLVIAFAAFALIRNSPEEMGISPAGKPDALAVHATTAPPGVLNRLGLLYGLFGATHVIYITFIVTMLVNERGFGEQSAGVFWAVFGLLSIVSGPVMGGLSDRIGRKKAIMIVFLLFTLAYVIVALSRSDVLLALSVIIFGVSSWGIPTILAATVGDYMGPEKAARAFGYITIFCGAGQVAGPALAGGLTDFFGTFSVPFFISAAVTLFAAVYAARFKDNPETRK